MRAKFRCANVVDYGGSKQAELWAVTGGSGENMDFNEATPAGNLKITIDKNQSAMNYFQPGKEYYLDFSEAPDA